MKAPTSAAVAAVTARLSYALLRARPPGGGQVWARTNHRGEPVTLLAGPATTAGALAGVLAGQPADRKAIAAAVAGLGAAAFGGYDDIAGNGDHRGFRGHVGALRAGELTTGMVKLAGLGLTGLAAASIAAKAGAATTGAPAGQFHRARLAGTDLLINAALVAGSGNLVNLFDLRPGRAIKVGMAAGALLAAAGATGPGTAAPVASAVALLPEDLGERAMLGDAGANALGAMLGLAAATSLPRTARIAVLAAVTGLTAASEVVSFTRVIERTGPLRWLDMLGRRPAAATGPDDTAGSAGADAPAQTAPHLNGRPVRSAPAP